MSKRRNRGGSSNVNLNSVIVPMLDMTFQILFFLILSFRPNDVEEGKVDFMLPASGEAKAKMPENVDPTIPSDKELALPANLTVMVKTVRDGVNDGNISAIVVKSLEGGEVALPDIPTLERYLKVQLGEVSNKEDIKIEAESKLKYSLVIDVMDACLKAGFMRVGFSPPPDLAN
jgi:biopolymer transport protein ExbD